MSSLSTRSQKLGEVGLSNGMAELLLALNGRTLRSACAKHVQWL